MINRIFASLKYVDIIVTTENEKLEEGLEMGLGNGKKQSTAE